MEMRYDQPVLTEMLLLCLIVNHGMGRKTMRLAKRLGITGGTVVLGRGTVCNSLLSMFELCDSRKEIILMVGSRETAMLVLDKLNEKLHLDQHHSGIGFCISISNLMGSHGFICVGMEKAENSGEEYMYKAIYSIVDKGKAEQVVEAAGKAGAKGGTIINARGSGIHETSKLFAMEIEPEKELVLIIVDAEKTQSVIQSINTDLELDLPGKGILFVMDIEYAHGLH